MGVRERFLLVALACVALWSSAVRGQATGVGQAAASHAPATHEAIRTAAPVKISVPAVRTATPAPVRRPAPKPAPDLRTVPFAVVGGIVLDNPAVVVERVGFHQASDIHDLQLQIARSAVKPKVLASRSRGTKARTAADIIVPPKEVIYAPVSGIVKRAKGYHLYCKYPDNFVAISPVGHPELEVKMLHITGLRVRPGDRVVAGKTPIAWHATKFPFVSEVDVFSAHRWPHVHVEVTHLAHPSAKPQPGKGLLFGCA